MIDPAELRRPAAGSSPRVWQGRDTDLVFSSEIAASDAEHLQHSRRCPVRRHEGASFLEIEDPDECCRGSRRKTKTELAWLLPNTDPLKRVLPEASSIITLPAAHDRSGRTYSVARPTSLSLKHMYDHRIAAGRCFSRTAAGFSRESTVLSGACVLDAVRMRCDQFSRGPSYPRRLANLDDVLEVEVRDRLNRLCSSQVAPAR